MRRRGYFGITPCAAFVVVAALVILWSGPAVDAASNWAVHLASGSKGEGHAQVLPSAPSGVAASCPSPTVSKTIKVAWNAVTHATSYSVYQSTTSATGTYSLAIGGLTTTSWTSGTLTSGTNYWYEVVVLVGSHWASANSSASGESTINSATPFCVQP